MSTQAQMFIASILCGIASMLLWDMLHGLRLAFFKGVIFNALLDFVWWICIGTGFIYCMWNYGSMQLRYFAFFGYISGAFLYRITLSGLLRRCFCKIFEVFYKIIRFIFKILLTPAAFLYKILVVCIFGKFARKIKRGNSK